MHASLRRLQPEGQPSLSTGWAPLIFRKDGTAQPNDLQFATYIDRKRPISYARFAERKKRLGFGFPAAWNCPDQFSVRARLLANPVEFPGAGGRRRLWIILVGRVAPGTSEGGGFFQRAWTRP